MDATNLVCLGCKGSGKTTFLRQLHYYNLTGELNKNVANTVPTVGTNLFTLTKRIGKRTITLEIREVGGIMVPLWDSYFQDCSKLVYIVDASNFYQVSPSIVYLLNVLCDPKLRKTQVLIVLNKTDLLKSSEVDEMKQVLRLEDFKQHSASSLDFIECSALLGKGLEDALKWIFTLKQ